MKLDTTINKYITGELFSSGLDFPFLSEMYPNETRLEKIIELTENKRVIHVGCADHLQLIEEKIKTKKWLHGLLIENTDFCIGIDNNQETVNFINKKLGLKDVYCIDITADNQLFSDNSQWDFMILGDIIEHIDNPVYFLSKIKENFEGKVDKILITVPNVYNLLTINDIKNNKENINTDHRYLYSPFTLTKVVSSSGFYNFELFFSERIKLPFLKAVLRRLKLLIGISSSFHANCFSSLIMIADFKK